MNIRDLPLGFTSEVNTMLYDFVDPLTNDLRPRKRLPDPIDYLGYNSYWLDKLKIVTWQDFADRFNSFGFCQELQSNIRYGSLGSYLFYDKDKILRAHYPDSPVLVYGTRPGRGANFQLVDPPVDDSGDNWTYYDTSRTDQSFKIIATKEFGDWSYHLEGYRFQPDQLNFIGSKGSPSPLYFGLELEISTRLTSGELQYIAQDVEPKQKQFFYLKHDGSITGRFDGKVELVTMPMHPRVMKKEFKTYFTKLEELCKLKGKEVKDFIDIRPISTNGLHIHVSKASFVRPKGRPDRLWKNKFASVWNDTQRSSQDFLQKLSRRITPISEAQYFKPHENMRGRTPAWKLTHGAYCMTGSQRYASARETDETVEVRVFQGQWDLSHVLYCIDITAAVHSYCQETSIRDTSYRFAESFQNWLSKQRGYHYAKKGLAECA
jgi:hypothetical protein